jgi:hypothetical protein
MKVEMKGVILSRGLFRTTGHAQPWDLVEAHIYLAITSYFR